MRQISLLATALLLCALAQARAASPDEDVRAAEKAWSTALIANDFAKLDNLLARDLIYGHATGNVETKDEYMTKLRSRAQKYDGLEYKDMKVKIFGDTAVVHAHVRMTGSTNGQPFDNQLLMLNVWIKQDGRWQMAGHQTANLK